MPEGHVIHRLAAALVRSFGGRVVSVSSPQGRFATEAALIDGSVLSDATAWGKHLFVHFSAGTVHIHLGLIGTMGFGPAAPPHGQVRLRISDGHEVADLRGPQSCALVVPEEEDAVIAKLGADPLLPVNGSAGVGVLNRGKLESTVRRTLCSSRPVGALLMDQGLFAGVGSIYRTEVLFRQGICPQRRGSELRSGELTAVWDDLVLLMEAGERTGRIDTVRPRHTPEAMGRAPRRDDHGGEVYVYRRAGQPCLVCGTPVQTGVLSGRKIYWCPDCQPVQSTGPSGSSR